MSIKKLTKKITLFMVKFGFREFTRVTGAPEKRTTLGLPDWVLRGIRVKESLVKEQ